MSGSRGTEKIFLDRTVFLRSHRSGIYVHIGVDFNGGDLQTGHLEQEAGGGR